MSNMIMKVAVANIMDSSRGIYLNRGAYVEAPPDFFGKYGKSLITPKVPYDPKKHAIIKVHNWDTIKKAMEPDKKKAPEPVVETTTVEAPTPVRATGENKPAMSTKDGSVPEDKPKPKGRRAKVK